jgi:pyrroloquinoline-quinone synthase
VQIMNFWTQLDAIREQCNVLEHPFYQRWSAGELSADELAHYAGEYHHAVVALAAASRSAANLVDPASEPQLRDELELHAAEEEGHIDLWEDFARVVGGTPSSNPNPETLACAEVWAGDDQRPLLDSLVSLYAIESGQPAISATKRAGLNDHYSVASGTATAYFELHERMDIEHAAAAKAMISERLQPADEDRLLAQAKRVLQANWQLLDGVERVAQAA